MKTYLVIKDEKVINAVVWDGESAWNAPEETTVEVAPIGVGIGWTRVGDEWTPPQPPPPSEAELVKISARAKLAALGLTEDEVKALLG